MNRRRNRTGFTLIEMLIALTMMAAILSMVYGSYAATSRTMQAYGSRMACSERGTLILRLMERQIRCAYMRPVEESAGKSALADVRAVQPNHPLPAFQGNAQDPQGQLLRFTTTSGMGGQSQRHGRLSRIGYRYDAVNHTLWIARHPLLEESGEADLRPNDLALLDQVAAVEVEFYNGRKWRPTWDSAKTGTLPRAVKIHLSLVDEQDRSYELGTTVRIETQTAMPRTQVKQNVRRGAL